MIRFVPDTNVLVSATIAREGPPGQILVAWLQGKAELATSPILLQELERVLKRTHIRKYQQLTADEIAKLVKLISQAGVMVPGQRQVRVIEEDPSDHQCAYGEPQGHRSGPDRIPGLKEPQAAEPRG